MTCQIERLAGAFNGGSGAIVSHGPSALNLRQEHFDGVDVVITINAAIMAVRPLGLQVPVFNMQKDAGEGRMDKDFRPICKICDKGCKGKNEPVSPEILLIHKHESALCFPDFPDRAEFDNYRFGLDWSFPSIISAIHIMHLFGVSSLRMISFDGIIKNICGQTLNGKDMDGTPEEREWERREREYAHIRQLLFLVSPMPTMSTVWVTP